MLGDNLNDRAFSIYDFVVFDYGKSGQMSRMFRIPKEEQNIELPGSIGHQRGLSLSLMMRRYNMFSYLKTMQQQGQPELVFTNTVDRKKRVYHTAVSASANGSYPSAPAEYTFPEKAPDQMNSLERLESKLDNFGNKLEKAVTGTDQSFTTFRDPYKGFAVAVPDEVLVYFYDVQTGNLNLRLEQMN